MLLLVWAMCLAIVFACVSRTTEHHWLINLVWFLCFGPIWAKKSQEQKRHHDQAERHERKSYDNNCKAQLAGNGLKKKMEQNANGLRRPQISLSQP
jgi:hypothetical protein